MKVRNDGTLELAHKEWWIAREEFLEARRRFNKAAGEYRCERNAATKRGLKYQYDKERRDYLRIP